MNQDTIEQLMALMGAIGTVASILATVLPKHWPLTQLLARFFADTRGVHAQSARLPPPTFYGRDEKTPAESPAAKRPSDPPPPETWR